MIVFFTLVIYETRRFASSLGTALGWNIIAGSATHTRPIPAYVIPLTVAAVAGLIGTLAGAIYLVLMHVESLSPGFVFDRLDSPASREQLFEEEGHASEPSEPATMPRINVRRVYEPPSSQDGQRVLVDRLWPRGLAKARAHLDVWLRNVAPSDELRRWYRHEPAKWHEFARRYRAELAEPDRQAALAGLHASRFLGASHAALCRARCHPQQR